LKQLGKCGFCGILALHFFTLLILEIWARTTLISIIRTFSLKYKCFLWFSMIFTTWQILISFMQR